MKGNLVFKFVAVFVLVAAIAGIAFFAFQAGVAKGSPVTIQAPSGETAAQAAPYYYGYGLPYRGHHMPFFGFGCFGLIIPIFLFFFAMKAMRMLFWGHHMHGHHYGHWGRRWENGAPPAFDEWHKKAHSEPSDDAQKPANDDKKE